MAVTAWELKERQALPLDIKINHSLASIKELHKQTNGMIIVNDSGGVDSIVTKHLVRMLFPNTPAAHVPTGLEFPELEKHVRQDDNLILVYPEMPHHKVVEKHGYLVISKKVSRYIWDLRRPLGANENTKHLRLTGYTKDGRYVRNRMLSQKWRFLLNAPFKISHKCCEIMKEKSLFKVQKETGRVPVLGILTEESRDRELDYLQHGCNYLKGARPKSTPIAFWTKHDVLTYIKRHNLSYPSVYGDIVEEKGILTTAGEKRTGCMYCLAGITQEKEPNRFQRMKETHPTHYRYCMDKLGLAKVLDYIGVPY